MPIGNATWGDFTCDSQAEMLANSKAVVGTTCLRTDLDAPLGQLLALQALPPSVPANWGSPFGSASPGLGENLLIYAWDPAYGGTWNGIADDKAALQAALNAAAAFTPCKDVMLPPLVGLSGPVVVPYRVRVIGYAYSSGSIKSQVGAIAGSNFTANGGWMFGLNTADGVTAVESVTGASPGWVTGMFGVQFYNPLGILPCGLVTFAGQNAIFVDLRGGNHSGLIRKVPGFYTDVLWIERISPQNPLDYTKWVIDITSGGGDCFYIHTVQCGTGSGTSEPIKIISVNSGMNGSISDIINGSILLTNVYQCTVERHHCEEGQMIFENSGGNLIASHYQCANHADLENNLTPVVLRATVAGAAQNYTVTLKDVRVIQGGLGQDLAPGDIQVSDRYNVTFDSCRVHNTNTGEGVSTGLRVIDPAGVPVAGWADNADYLSTRGQLIGNRLHGMDLAFIPDATIPGITSGITKKTNPSFGFAPSTQYFYNSQFIIDLPTMRGQNCSSGEVSVTTGASPNTESVYFPIGYGNCSLMGILRIYRGTASNMYDSVANVPVIATRGGTDIFTSVLGVAWIPRAAAAMDAVTPVTGNFIRTPKGLLTVA